MIVNFSFSLLSLGEQFYFSLSSQQNSCCKGIFLLTVYQVYYSHLCPTHFSYLLMSLHLSFFPYHSNWVCRVAVVTLQCSPQERWICDEGPRTKVCCQQRGYVNPTPPSSASSYCCHLCERWSICTWSVIQVNLAWISCQFQHKACSGKEGREHIWVVSFAVSEFLCQYMTILKMHPAASHPGFFLLLIRTNGCLKSWNGLDWKGL